MWLWERCIYSEVEIFSNLDELFVNIQPQLSSTSLTPPILHPSHGWSSTQDSDSSWHQVHAGHAQQLQLQQLQQNLEHHLQRWSRVRGDNSAESGGAGSLRQCSADDSDSGPGQLQQVNISSCNGDWIRAWQTHDKWVTMLPINRWSKTKEDKDYIVLSHL